MEHPTLEQFSTTLSRFIEDNTEVLKDFYWRHIIGFFKRQRYFMMSTPLSFRFLGMRESENAAIVERRIGHAPYVFPDLADDATSILALYKRLTLEDGNPLTIAFHEHICLSEASAPIAILLRDGRWITSVEKMFSETLVFQDVHVVSPEALKGKTCYDTIFCVGPAKWFPDYVFFGGRASTINLYYYAWLGDRSPGHETFLVPTVKIKRKKPEILYVKDDRQLNLTRYPQNESVDAHTVIPEVDLQMVRERMRQASDPTEQGGLYEVDAKLFVLEGDAMVMLESSDNAKSYVIDPISFDSNSEDEEDDSDDKLGEFTEEAGVIRINTADIQPGMFLLIRTSGGGDYIAPIADNILGKYAPQCRSVQREWKRRLKEKIIEFGGIDETVERLRHLGSEKANHTNLRNWTAERTICTRDRTDFFAIMRLIGLEDQKEKFWEISQKIHSAHTEAGFLIRRILLDKIKHANLGELERKGRMDFSFDDTDNSNMAVIRVKSIVDEHFSVPESSLGKLLEGQ
ncbi:MAG: hypothetical protein ACP5LD_10135 [Desulfomonilaceae bacterium]